MPVLRSSPSRRSTRSVLGLLLTVALVVACGGAELSPNPSLRTLPPAASPSDLPTGGPGGPTTAPIGTPSRVPWPSGWDTAFCALFSQLVETQELAVDIGRALDDGERSDARGLTAELAVSATTSGELLGELPEWATDASLRTDIEALLDLADEMALRYDRYLNRNRNQALANAQAAGRQMAGVVEPLLERVTLLAEQGLSCPGVPFALETPADR